MPRNRGRRLQVASSTSALKRVRPPQTPLGRALAGFANNGIHVVYLKFIRAPISDGSRKRYAAAIKILLGADDMFYRPRPVYFGSAYF